MSSIEKKCKRVIAFDNLKIGQHFTACVKDVVYVKGESGAKYYGRDGELEGFINASFFRQSDEWLCIPEQDVEDELQAYIQTRKNEELSYRSQLT